MPEVLKSACGECPGKETMQKNELQKVRCKSCGKTLMFLRSPGKENNECAVVEIKCRNRECRALNEIRLCHIICE